TNGANFTWEGLSYFGVGALAGASTLLTITGVGAAVVPALAGGITSSGNSTIAQGFAGGDGNTWNGSNIDWGQVGISAITGAITGYVGGQIAGKLTPYVTKYISGHLGGPVVQDMVTNSLTNGATGFTIGAGVTALNGGSFDESMHAGWNSAKVGLTVGAATGAVSGFQRAKTESVNPWTGKETVEISQRAIDSFKEHAFANGRHVDIGVSEKKITTKTQELIKKNASFLHEGDNTFTLNVNGTSKIIRVNMQSGSVRSFNLMPNNGINIRSSTPIINLPNQKW
ncbi:hypothetical protein LJB92_04030, partial [Bacteroidales bacterium OttesenSCG-928-M06]|nr:hypothetical protein [Bacteroidales bacterium OttesenSCG-928-M06]